MAVPFFESSGELYMSTVCQAYVRVGLSADHRDLREIYCESNTYRAPPPPLAYREQCFDPMQRSARNQAPQLLVDQTARNTTYTLTP